MRFTQERQGSQRPVFPDVAVRWIVTVGACNIITDDAREKCHTASSSLDHRPSHYGNPSHKFAMEGVTPLAS